MPHRYDRANKLKLLSQPYFQSQKTEAIKKETEKLRAIADAERNKAVLKIQIEERILEKAGEANISALNNEILKAELETGFSGFKFG